MAEAHLHSEVSDTSRWIAGLAVGGALVGGGIILAPHVLPALGIGAEYAGADAMHLMHTVETSADLPITVAGSGVAGFINRGIANYVPFIGEEIAKGGMFNILATATVGIGGVMLGRFMDDGENKDSINWGKTIQYAALATSALIALPAVITGIGVGLTYLSMLAGNDTVTKAVKETVFHYSGISGGSMNNTFMGFSGATAAVPHFLTCGISMVPAMVGLQLWNEQQQEGAPRVEITLPDTLTPGVSTAALVKLSHANGKPLTAEELKVVHTEKVHLFIADQSLTDYHHIHPQPTGTPGVYAAPFTPHSSNAYRAWVELTPLASDKEHIVQAKMHQPARTPVPTPVVFNNTAQKDGMEITWEPTAPLKAGEDATIKVRITENGKPVADLEPLLGAYAHLAGFAADGTAMVHCHPLGTEPKQASDRGAGELEFHITPKTGGPTKFYLQFQRGGEEVFVPFGQLVAPATKHAERVAANHGAHGASHAR